MRQRSKWKLFFIPLGIAAFFGVSYVVMELWNNILPRVLHVGAITFWQAVGIFILCKILFGFGHRGHGGAPWMRSRIQERFKNMSPEEREKFREKWEQRCGKFGKDWPGRGNRHAFEQEWDNNAAEAATKVAE